MMTQEEGTGLINKCTVKYCPKQHTNNCYHCPANPDRLLECLTDEDLEKELRRRKDERD